MKKQGGVTLIELMIVVVVAGILASIAVPSYMAHIVRGKIAQGTEALSEAKVRMEQNFNSLRTYYKEDGATCRDLSALFSDTPFDVGVVCDATTFTVTATGKSAQGMSGYTYVIDQTGTKTSKTPAVSTTQQCWLMSKDAKSC